MSSDLRLEIFAFQFFQTHWCRSGYMSQIRNASSMYPDEFHLELQNTEMYEESHVRAVFVKEFFYHCVFYDELCKITPDFQCSPSYILDLISHTCKREVLLADLNVFELLFTSCAFIINLVLFCVECYGYRDVLSYAHLCWASYFDEFKEEFYRQGGWNQLLILSLSYTMAFELVFSFPNMHFKEENDRRDSIRFTMGAVNNYKSFTSCFDADSETVSKGWAKFHLQNNKFNASSSEANVIKEEDMMDPKIIEKFLLQFRRLCDPDISEVLNVFSCSLSCFENSDSGKPYTEVNVRSLQKLANLTLNDLTSNSTSETQIEQRKNVVDLQEIAVTTDNVIATNLSKVNWRDDQTKKGFVKDLSGVKRNDDETEKVIEMDLSRSKQTTFNGKEEFQNAVFKMQFSNDDSSLKETPSTSKEKVKEDATRKEIDLEREIPEVQCLLKMILLLGDTEGVAHIQSALRISDMHQQMKKSKTKSKKK